MSTTTVTQPSFRKNLTVIPGVGFSSATVDAAETGANTKINRRSGINAGVLLEIGRQMVTFQTGLVYMQDGFKATSSRAEGGYTYVSTANTQLDYLGVPLLAKLNFRFREPIAIYGKAGLIPAVTTGVYSELGTQDHRPDGSIRERNYVKTGRENLRDVNVLAAAGAGMAVLGRERDYRAEVMLNRSLLSVAQNSTAPSVYTTAFMIQIGMGFNL